MKKNTRFWLVIFFYFKIRRNLIRVPLSHVVLTVPSCSRSDVVCEVCCCIFSCCIFLFLFLFLFLFYVDLITFAAICFYNRTAVALMLRFWMYSKCACVSCMRLSVLFALLLSFVVCCLFWFGLVFIFIYSFVLFYCFWFCSALLLLLRCRTADSCCASGVPVQ